MGKDNSKRNTIIGASIAGVVLLIALIVRLAMNGGDETPNSGAPANVGGGPAKKVDAYSRAYDKAFPNGTIEDIKRLGNMAWERHQAGKGDATQLHKWDLAWRWCCRQMIANDKDDALAHERLGHVLFDLKEAEAMIERPGLTENMKDDIRFLIEDAEVDFKNLRKVGRIWLSKKNKKEREFGERWIQVRDRTDKTQGAEAARASDPFYPTAEKFGKRLAKALDSGAVDFRIDGVKDSPFGVHVHKPYVYLVQRSSTGFEDRVARQWDEVLQALRVTFYRQTGDACGVPAETRPTPVVILRDSQEYTKYRRRGDDVLPTPITSSGHFEPATNRLVCYRSSEDAQRKTLFHEGTHQIVNWAMLKGIGGGAWVAALGNQSFWFSEGIGDYYGGHGDAYEGVKRVFVPGKIHVHHVDALVAAKQRGGLTPLAELLQYRRIDFQRDNGIPAKRNTVLNGYSHGWALCYLIQNWKKDKYGAKWNDYAKEEFNGRSGENAFNLTFGAGSVATMQQEFEEMIDTLGNAKKEGKIVNGEVVN